MTLNTFLVILVLTWSNIRVRCTSHFLLAQRAHWCRSAHWRMQHFRKEQL